MRESVKRSSAGNCSLWPGLASEPAVGADSVSPGRIFTRTGVITIFGSWCSMEFFGPPRSRSRQRAYRARWRRRRLRKILIQKEENEAVQIFSSEVTRADREPRAAEVLARDQLAGRFSGQRILS